MHKHGASTTVRGGYMVGHCYLRWLYVPRRYRINGELVRPYLAALVEPTDHDADTPKGFYHGEQGAGIRPALPKSLGGC